MVAYIIVEAIGALVLGEVLLFHVGHAKIIKELGYSGFKQDVLNWFSQLCRLLQLPPLVHNQHGSIVAAAVHVHEVDAPARYLIDFAQDIEAHIPNLASELLVVFIVEGGVIGGRKLRSRCPQNIVLAVEHNVRFGMSCVELCGQFVEGIRSCELAIGFQQIMDTSLIIGQVRRLFLYFSQS